MLDSFNIKITKLVKLPQLVIDNYPEEYGDATDIVTAVHFIYTGIKNGITSQRPGLIGIEFVKDSENFTPFNQLTPEQITAWVESAVGEEKLNEIKTEMEQEIDSKLEDKLPWE